MFIRHVSFFSSYSYSIYHLFEKEGDRFEYMYDFGDHFRHTIVVRYSIHISVDAFQELFLTPTVAKVEKVVPEEESDGQVRILGGGGMCPGGANPSNRSPHECQWLTMGFL